MSSIKQSNLSDITFRAFNAIIMFIVSFLMINPFIYMVMLSLSGGNTYAKILILPVGFTLDAYEQMIFRVKFFDGFFISFLRSTIGPICTLFFTYMGGYVLSRQELLFRKFFLKFVVFTMYFSAGILPVYINMVQLHLTNSFFVYIIPGLISVFEIILIKTFIEEQPRSLEESAVIDGANDIQIAFRVVFHLCLPVLAACTLFNFVGQWNSYTDTLLYNSQRPKLFTLQYILTCYLQSQTVSSPEDLKKLATAVRPMSIQSLKMAMTVLVCIPIMVVYPFLQKYFVKGLMIGAIKG